MNKFSCFNLNLLLLTSHFLLPPFLIAQTPEWVYQYVNPQRSEWPSVIVADSVGNSYTTGLISAAETSGIGIIKLNSAGGIQWLYFNDSFGGGVGYDLIFKDGQLFLGGVTGTGHMVAICVDTSGQELWFWVDTVFSSTGYALAVSSIHNVYIAGRKSPAPSDWLVVKMDSFGNEKWRYVYDGPANSYDEATSIAIDMNENIYVGGYSTGIGTAEDFTVIKLDSAGNEKWVYRYDGPANYRDELKALALDTLGHIYGAGGSWSDIGSWDFLVVKLDSMGDEQWVYRFDGYAHYYDWAEDIVIDDSGFVYACGLSYLYEDTLQYFAVIALNSVGVECWRYLTAGPLGYGGYPRSMTLDGLGAIYACGNLDGYLAVVRLSRWGNEDWVYKDPYAMIARDIVADAANNVYVTGERRVSQWDYDIVVMKFAVQVDAEEVKKERIVDNKSKGSIFRGGVNILVDDGVQIVLYDVTGRIIMQQSFSSQQQLNISLQPGVYFLAIEARENKVLKKIIIL